MSINENASITLPLTLFQSAPEAVRFWLTAELNLMPAGTGEQPRDGEREVTVGRGTARLSDGQARRFLEGVQSPKTRQALRVMCELGPRFRYVDFLREMGLTTANWDDLTGVWAGLTRRTRTITEDPEAILITWMNFDSKDRDEDSIGEMNPATVAAFRSVLGS